jgi:hypothetical protein
MIQSSLPLNILIAENFASGFQSEDEKWLIFEWEEMIENIPLEFQLFSD